MIAIPFIYFLFLSIRLTMKTKKIEIGAVIALLYSIMGFFSILMVQKGEIRPVIANSVTIIPTIVYCFLLTMVMIPFLKYPSSLILDIKPIRNEKFLITLSWVAIIWFILTVFFSFSHFRSILSGDMLQLRTEIYKGQFENNWFSSVPVPLRVLMVPLSFIFGCPWVLIFLGFFTRYIQKLPSKYSVFFIIASLSGPWGAILAVDRSAVTYWIIAFAMIFLLFSKYMSKVETRKMGILMIVLVSLLGLYLLINTVSRFAGGDFNDMSESNSSVISYLGQSFPNFCYFFENFECDWKTLGLIFPFTNKYLFGGITGGVPIQEQVEKLTPFTVGVFYTFMGQILISAGRLIMVLYCIIHTVISSKLISPCRHKRVTCLTAYYYILMSSVLFLGLFVHYYSSPTLTTSVIFNIFLIRYMEKSTGKSTSKAHHREKVLLNNRI